MTIRPAARRFSPFDEQQRRSLSAVVWLLVLVVLFPRVAHAQFGSTPTDGIRLPETSVTVRDDALSLELNPAGLAFIQGFDGQIASTSIEDDLLAGTGLFLGFGAFDRIGVGASFQWLQNPSLGGDFKKFTFGLAGRPTHRVSVGLTYNFADSDTSLSVDQFSSWNAGFLVRILEWWGVAGTVRDFNTPRLGGTAVDPRYIAGTALRFAEGRYRAEFEGIYDAGPEDWYLKARAAAEPLDGLSIFAELQTTAVDDFGVAFVQAGLSFSFGLSSVTGAVVADVREEDALTGSAFAIRAVSRPLRTVLEPDGFMAGLTLSGAPPERGRESFILGDQRSFLDLLTYLDELSRDEHVRGLVLRLEHVSLGLGQHWELHRALTRLRERGKEVVVHLGTADFGDYYLASAADTVYISPGTPLFPAGLSTTLTYIGELFENVGIVPEIVRIGEYKSAAEALTESSPSEQTLEAANAYLDDVFDAMVAAIAEGRGRSVEEIRSVVDTSPIAADEAEERGLVDGVCFPDELRDVLGELHGQRINIVDSYDPDRWHDYRWTEHPIVAVVYVDGDIIQGRSGRMPIVGETAGHRTLIDTLDTLSRNPRVRAIVLRIDSPGGSAWASEAIWRAVDLADERKPVVVSMGNIAASGGYYVAAGGREIYATDLTLTGSIGIFSGHFVARELFDWAGIHRFPILRGLNANLFGLDDRWTETQREAIWRDVQILYDTFLQRVADNRDREPSDIDPIAQGRIWSGHSALDVGLVDEIGSLLDAIERAKVLAGLPADAEVRLIQRPERSVLGFLSVLNTARAGDLSETEAEALAEVIISLGLDEVLRFPLLYGDGRPAARLDVEVEGLE